MCERTGHFPRESCSFSSGAARSKMNSKIPGRCTLKVSAEWAGRGQGHDQLILEDSGPQQPWELCDWALYGVCRAAGEQRPAVIQSHS